MEGKAPRLFHPSAGMLAFEFSTWKFVICFTTAVLTTIIGNYLGSDPGNFMLVIHVVIHFVIHYFLVVGYALKLRQNIAISAIDLCDSVSNDPNEISDFQKRLDMNLSRAENAINLIRYIQTANIPNEMKLCLRYCEQVLQMDPEEVLIPQALLQLSVMKQPDRPRSDDVTEWLISQFTCSKGAASLQHSNRASIDKADSEELDPLLTPIRPRVSFSYSNL